MVAATVLVNIKIQFVQMRSDDPHCHLDIDFVIAVIAVIVIAVGKALNEAEIQVAVIVIALGKALNEAANTETVRPLRVRRSRGRMPNSQNYFSKFKLCFGLV